MGIAIPQLAPASLDRTSGAQVIDGSLKFDETKSQHLKRTPSSAGNRKTHTLSCWVKKTKNTDGSAYFMILAAGSGSTNRSYVSFKDNDTLQSANIVSGSVRDTIETTALLRDAGIGWYHLVVSIDTTQSTAADRVKIYINGELQSDSGTNPSQNAESFINSTNAHYIGETATGAEYFDGFMSQVYFIDGQQLGPESFGFTDPLTNTWKPKKYKVPLTETVTVQPSYVSKSNVLDEANAFDGSSATEATYSGTGSWLSFTVSDASNLTVPFRIRNDSSGTGQTVAMFTDSSGSSAAGGSWGSTGTNNLSPAVSTTVDDTYTFPSTGTYYLRHTVGSDSNIFVYKIGGDVTTGANSFYLPLDGNSPIGKDQSGNGNDWTPVNFGGSVALDNPQVSGARPILNTTQGGAQAGVGVFGSKQNVGYAVTVYNDGGGNKYYIDGVKQDTVTGLIRGATYTFDTSDSTVSSHPFRFSATSNGSHGGGSEYTTGVAAITGAATTITVPHDAPNTLYYYCTSHSGMGADITGITTNEKLADQYASSIVLALPLVGNTNDTSASIACTSTTKSVTNNGATASSTRSNFYNGSFDFDGGDDLEVSSSSEFNYGTGDFTWEAWVYKDTSTNNQYIIDHGSNNGSLLYGSGNQIRYYDGTNSRDFGTLAQNKWHHVAVCRSSSVTNGFLDGKKTELDSSDSKDYPTQAVSIGEYGGGSYNWEGNIQDVRLYKGVAKYTSDFVVPSPSPDILPDTPSGVSGGSKLTKITGGAVSFDGTNDYLTIADSDDFNLGSGAFTIEGFCYLRSSSAQQFLVGMWTGNQLSYAVQTSNDANRYLRFLISDDGTGVDFDKVSTGSLRLNGWSHFAVTRSGNTFYLFVDGILVGTQSASNTLHNSTGTLAIGARNDGTQDLNGFISNVRIIKGTALYTSRFTPPTAPLTNVTNTKLLTCQSTSFYAAVAPLVSGVNNGTVWSSSLTGGSLFRSGYPAVDAFNGVTKTSTEDCAATPQVAGQGFTFLFGGGVPFTTLQMQCDHNNGATVTANGVNITSQLSSGSLTNTTITGVTSPLTSLSVVSHNGDAGYLGSVTIDGTMLVDPFVPNGGAAATNFNPFNTDINTVRGQETEYCTWNPLSGQYQQLADGNLDAESSTISSYATIPSTIPMTSGKWYAEFTYRENIDGDGDGSNFFRFGISQTDRNFESGSDPLGTSKDFGWKGAGTLTARTNGSNSYTYTGNTVADGDILSLAFDADAGKLWIARNGTYATNSSGTGDPANGNNPDYSSLTYSGGYFFVAGPYAGAQSPANGGGRLSAALVANFGQKPFKFPPPDGFQPLNAANTRPVKVISRPDQFVGISTWTGDGNTGRNIRTLQFKPDLVWIKQRSATRAHALFDSVRGANKRLQSSSSNAETTHTDQMSAFIDNGFTVEDNNTVNVDSGTYVGWSWRAGGNKNTFNVDGVGYATTTAAGLTAGDVSPTGASVGTKQGFSIIRWTAPTWNGGPQQVPHGLTQSPSFIIAKVINDAASWYCYHKDLDASNPQDKYIVLNDTSATGTLADSWGTSAPDSTTFGDRQLGWSGGTNVISYIWHDVPGLQKFGKYSGSGSSGNFIELGFRPALLLIKSTSAYGWAIVDTTRSDYNVKVASLYPNKNDAEYTGSGHEIDYLSNGFVLRNTNDRFNKSSTDYIYAAWAEAPSIDLYGGGANAR